MKTTKYLLFFTSLFLLLFSCGVSEEDYPGTYTSINIKNHIDTVFIYKNGTFERRLYQKSDGKLLVQHGGKWRHEGATIALIDFYIDQDNVWGKQKKFFPSDKVEAHFLITKSFNGDIDINYGIIPDEQKFIYRKIR